MRQAKKEIQDKRIIEELLRICPVGRLGTAGRDGYPMVKPLNFAYDRGKIYFHSARDGEKIDDIRRDERVCFETDLPMALVRSRQSPCRATYLYRSVIIKGRARIVCDEVERILGLKLLMGKYQPECGYGEFPPDKLSITAVVRIDIEEATGKEDLGEGIQRQELLEALDRNAPLPVVLTREK